MADSVVTYEALSTAATNVAHHKQNFDDMIKGMDGIVSSLEGEWKGQAKAEFENEFAKLKPTLEKFSELLGRYSDELNKHVNRTIENEAAGKQSINQSLSF